MTLSNNKCVNKSVNKHKCWKPTTLINKCAKKPHSNFTTLEINDSPLKIMFTSNFNFKTVICFSYKLVNLDSTKNYNIRWWDINFVLPSNRGIFDY